jgi:hypothetical protein
MKRLIFVLAATMTLMLIAGPIYAGPPDSVPPDQGVTFVVNWDCKPIGSTIGELQDWCDLWAAGEAGAVGPAILTFCPKGSPPNKLPRRIAPNGFCDSICGPTEVEVNCSVRVVE